MTENLRYQANHIEYDDNQRRLSISWGDGHRSEFPYIWLRHACMFPLMGRPGQPKDDYLQPENPADMSIRKVELDANRLVIQWVQDSNPTLHDLTFLRDHCLSKKARLERRPPPELWSSALADGFEWFDGAGLEDPQQRLEIFLHLRSRGIALLKQLPQKAETLREVARHFGPVRQTHFGDLFDIRSLPDDQTGTGANIGATSCNALSPHTDEGWRHGPPGISIMHCLRADPSGGGISVFVDGIAAAEALRESDPEAFNYLTRVPLCFAATRNPRERFHSRARVIAADSDGVVRGIRVTDRTILPPDVDTDDIETAYRALGVFYRMLMSPDFRLEHLLRPGEAVAFDNHRVLHARRAFDPQAGERWIQQLSIDREEFQNLFRQLAETQNRFDLCHWEQDAGALSQSAH